MQNSPAFLLLQFDLAGYSTYSNRWIKLSTGTEKQVRAFPAIYNVNTPLAQVEGIRRKDTYRLESRQKQRHKFRSAFQHALFSECRSFRTCGTSFVLHLDITRRAKRRISCPQHPGYIQQESMTQIIHRFYQGCHSLRIVLGFHPLKHNFIWYVNKSYTETVYKEISSTGFI